MLATPMDVLLEFPVRKTRQQKQAFRDSVQSYAQSLGYAAKSEPCSFGGQNLIFGDPEKAEILVTAHYDTPAKMLFPNFIAPKNLLLNILYPLFQITVMVAVSIFVGVIFGVLVSSPQAAGIFAAAFYWLLLAMLRIGPQNKHNANDNTSGVVTVLEIMRSLLPAHREKVCFVLFDLEEAGLIGSASYRKAHKKVSENQLVLNLDCVGDGDHIWFFPSRKLKKDTAKMAKLRRCSGWFGPKCIRIHEKGFSQYPSDHIRFPRSVGIGAFHQKKGIGPCLSRIHTAKDTVLEETNVNILRACIATLISAQ